MKHKVLVLVLSAAASLAATNPGVAHPGDVDSQGCHYERRAQPITAIARADQSEHLRARQEIAREHLPRRALA